MEPHGAQVRALTLFWRMRALALARQKRRLAGDIEEPVDVVCLQNLRQRAAALGAGEDGGRIVGAIAVDDQELVELPDRRKFSRGGRGRELPCRKRGQIGPDRLGFRRFRRAARRLEMSKIIVQIAGVGLQRVGGGPALRRKRRDKRVDPRLCGPRNVAHLLSRPAGMVCVISRGCGSTNVTSATIVPQTTPTTTATNSRKRRMAGKGPPVFSRRMGGARSPRRDHAQIGSIGNGCRHSLKEA